MTAIRFWTTREIELLRRDYGTRPIEEVCCLLDRTVFALHHAARLYGVTRKMARPAPDTDRAICRLNAEGKSDGQIARALRLNRTTVTLWRNRLGLPANRRPGCAAGSEEVAEVNARLDARARARGFPNWGSWMVSRRRLYRLAEAPGCTTVAQVAVCRKLNELGPLPEKEVVAATADGPRPGSLRRAVWELLKHKILRRDDQGRLFVWDRKAGKPTSAGWREEEGGRH